MAIRSLDGNDSNRRNALNISGEQLMNVVSRLSDINDTVTDLNEEITELLRELDTCSITVSDRAEERNQEEDDFRAMIKAFGPYILLFNMIRESQGNNQEENGSDSEN